MEHLRTLYDIITKSYNEYKEDENPSAFRQGIAVGLGYVLVTIDHMIEEEEEKLKEQENA